MSEYKDLPGVNQSRLKEILKHPSLFRDYRTDSNTTEYFAFGTFVEDLLLADDDYMASKYFITKSETPSDAIVRVLNLLAEQSIELHLDAIDQDVVIQACIFCEYGKSWKPETCYKKILESGSDYYYEIKQSEGLIKMSQEDYDKGALIVNEALSNLSVRKYLRPMEGLENNFKVPIEFTYRDRLCKGEIDILHIDHNKKTVQVIDIKTSSYAMFFQSSILKFRYDFQADFYTMGLILGGLVPEGYNILPALFLVLDSNGKLPATMWQTPIKLDFNSDRSIEDLGVDFEYNDRIYEGVNSAFDRLFFHEKNDVWDYPLEYYERGYMKWS